MMNQYEPSHDDHQIREFQVLNFQANPTGAWWIATTVKAATERLKEHEDGCSDQPGQCWFNQPFNEDLMGYKGIFMIYIYIYHVCIYI
jgi:hypothetical protein